MGEARHIEFGVPTDIDRYYRRPVHDRLPLKRYGQSGTYGLQSTDHTEYGRTSTHAFTHSSRPLLDAFTTDDSNLLRLGRHLPRQKTSSSVVRTATEKSNHLHVLMRRTEGL